MFEKFKRARDKRVHQLRKGDADDRRSPTSHASGGRLASYRPTIGL
jgi:hypothetical protein